MASFITLLSNDDKTFNVKPEVASMNNTLKDMLEGGVFLETNQTPLTVDGETLGKILEYCTWHYENPEVIPEPEPKPEPESKPEPASEPSTTITTTSTFSVPMPLDPTPQIKKRMDTDICEWDVAFLKRLTEEQLHKIIFACDYLNNKPLLEIACKTVVNSLRGKTAQDMREKFNIENDFTKEEEQHIMDTNDWCELYHADNN